MDEQSPEQPHGALYGRLRWMHPGCLMWILISAVCISTVWIGPLLNLGSTGSELLDLIIFFAIGTSILWLIMTTTEYLTGDSGSPSGSGEPGSLDRGAGTMSWYDSNDGGGSE